MQLRQLRANKREQAVSLKRHIGVEGQPPHLVVLVPVSHDVRPVLGMLSGSQEGDVITVAIPELRERFTIAVPTIDSLTGLLDLVKVMI